MAVAPPLLQGHARAQGHTTFASVGNRAPAKTQQPAKLESLRFSSAPAFFASCCFALGVLGAHLFWLTPGLLLVGVFALAGLALLSAERAPRVVLAPLAALFLLLGALSTETQPPVSPQRELAQLADGAERVVTGEVVRLEPVKRTSHTSFFGHKTTEEQAQRVDLKVRAVGPTPVEGGLRLTLYAPLDTPMAARLPALACGSRLRVVVAMHTEARYLDPGVWDTSAYLHEQGIGALGSAAANQAKVLGQGTPGFACRLHLLQTTASSRIVALAGLPLEQRLPAPLRLSEADASMLTAMLTGDRSYLQHATRIGFERTGSFHLLVVSGMHLAIFASVIFLFARLMRLPNLAATALTLALSFAYALFTGFGQPVQRSFWMVALFLVGRLIFRERHALQALGLASLCLVAASPRALFGSSLQMTLLSVVAIGGIAAPLLESSLAPYLRATRNLWLLALDPSLPPKIAEYRVTLRLLLEHLQPLTGRWFARRAVPWCVLRGLQALELLLISILVELIMALPMAVYFHRITVLGLPVNFLIVPFLGLLLPAALATFAVLLVSPSLAVVPAAIAAGLLHIVNGIVTFFSTMHAGDYRIPAPPPGRVVVWILLIAASIWLVRRPQWSRLAACACLLAASLLTVAPQPVLHRAGTLEVTAIDVGQGDGLLVITPDGRTLLVDAGGIAGAPKDSSFNMGEDVISPVLWSRGIQRLDAVAISHAHTDHIGGMPAVLANFHPRAIWVGNNPASPEYTALLAEAASLGIPLVRHQAGDRWEFGSQASTRAPQPTSAQAGLVLSGKGQAGLAQEMPTEGVEVQALWPSATYVPRAEPTNNDSLVLRLAYGQTSVLLEGDAEAPAEEAMLAAGVGHSDLLKVGHHGSRSSTIPPFLAAVSPRYAAISVGRHNYYGHPRHETLDKLEAAHVRTYRTDMFGATTFYLDGRTVTASPWATAVRPWYSSE